MKNYQLPNQDKDEKIVMLLRRHWMYFAGPAIALFALAVILIIFYAGSAVYFPFVLAAPYLNLVLLITCLYLLFVWLFFFLVWTDYYLDIWIITDKRIVDIEQMGLFKREVSEFKLFRIQDVTIEVKGVLPTFLNYGNVYVQTAGENREFVFKQVPNPHKAKDLIIKLHTKAQAEQVRR